MNIHKLGWTTLFIMSLCALIAAFWPQGPDTPPYAQDCTQIADSTWLSPEGIVSSSSVNQRILDSVPGVQCVYSKEDGDSVVWYSLPDSISVYSLNLKK
jgi:hypothetical protein